MNHIEYYKDKIRENGFYNAYVEALFFTDTGSDSEIGSDCELSQSAKEQALLDCARFLFLAEGTIQELKNSGVHDWKQLGHDFWLTRNRHGVGFWDRGNGAFGDQLTKICNDNFKSVDVYRGDDGFIYFA